MLHVLFPPNDYEFYCKKPLLYPLTLNLMVLYLLFIVIHNKT